MSWVAPGWVCPETVVKVLAEAAGPEGRMVQDPLAGGLTHGAGGLSVSS